MDDKQILDLYWERSEAAISETSKKYGKYCRYIAFNILHNDEDSEECVNDTYLRAWNSIPPNRPSVLKTFLGKITRNLSLDRYELLNAKKRNGGHIHVFESAIDLLSFATLTLLAGRDWKSETYLSLAGVFQTKREDVVPVALSRFLDEHPSVRKIHLHLDNDTVGRGAVKGIVGGLQGRYQVYDEPPSRGKDVNDELKIRVGLMRERKERERT